MSLWKWILGAAIVDAALHNDDDISNDIGEVSDTVVCAICHRERLTTVVCPCSNTGWNPDRDPRPVVQMFKIVGRLCPPNARPLASGFYTRTAAIRWLELSKGQQADNWKIVEDFPARRSLSCGKIKRKYGYRH